jgi:hypothetical protein
MITNNIIMKILIEYTIHYFCLAIGLRMEGMLNFSFFLAFFINNIQNFDMNSISRSFIMTSNIPLCQTYMSKNSFVVLATVAFMWVDVNLLI